MGKGFMGKMVKNLGEARLLGAAGVAGFLAVFFLASTNLFNLKDAWQTPEYSHGLLIPFIALLIGGHRLAEKKPQVRPCWVGNIVLLVGLSFIVISHLSAFEPPAHYGFVLALVGLSLAFYGKGVTGRLMPAFIYLLFAIPLPRLIYVTLSADMQLVSSNLGVAVLQLLGISVFQEGNIIDLGNYKLQVAEACNGLRYLFPLMSFGFLIALLYEDRMWKRVVLFLSTIPITIGMNSLRIAVIGITVNQWGTKMAEGVIHDFEGWVVFSLCVALLLAEMALFKRLSRQSAFRFDYLWIPRGPFVSGESKLKMPGMAALSLSLLAVIFFSGSKIDNRVEITPPHPAFASFPTQIGDWHGKPEGLPGELLSALALSDYWMADYATPNNPAPVSLYMAYYKSQRVGSSIHSPANCLPGGGWRIEKREVTPVAAGIQTIPVTRLLIREGDKALLVYYWFDGRGRILNEQYSAKWYLLVDSIKMHRTDGALVRLTTPLLPHETEQAADNRLSQFLSSGAYQAIKSYIPQ